MRSGIKEDTRWCEVKNADLRVLSEAIAACSLDVSGKGTFKDEFVTAGGVALSGVDMKRMESKSVKGLYFAGEVLDVDGITGGFNFQSAWTTGWTAGQSIAEDAGGEEERLHLSS
jgi:predicted flavoprotein YhiN